MADDVAGRRELLPLPGAAGGLTDDSRGFPLSLLLRVLSLALFLALPICASTDPFTPSDDSFVVARLRSQETSAGERRLRSARAAAAADRANLPLALAFARQCIQHARAAADPRFLGQAQVALRLWWTNAAPPVEVLVLRATIRQSRHDFPTALADLDSAIARDPRHAGAWLTKATVHTVRAEYAEARRAAAHLLGLTDTLTATTAIAQIVALDGDAAAACRHLEAALSRAENDLTGSDPETRVWAHTVLAETAARLGQAERAEHHFRAGLQVVPRDPYLLGAFADFLLDQHRPAEVIALLKEHTRIDGLRLRLAEAQRAHHPGTEAAHVAELDARFAAAQARGERVHLREEARFRLRLLDDAQAALPLAEANWQIQKEPADARLLDETRRKLSQARNKMTKAQ